MINNIKKERESKLDVRHKHVSCMIHLLIIIISVISPLLLEMLMVYLFIIVIFLLIISYFILFINLLLQLVGYGISIGDGSYNMLIKNNVIYSIPIIIINNDYYLIYVIHEGGKYNIKWRSWIRRQYYWWQSLHFISFFRNWC